MPTQIAPPASGEHAEYYGTYINLAIPRGNVLDTLTRQIDEVQAALGHLTDEQALFRDAPNEWSIKQVLGHLNDGERVFSYRLQRISRNDKTPLPGFEQNDFVREAGFDAHPFQSILQEFEFLRRANLLAIRNMTEEQTTRIGTASGNPFSARALIYVLAGHVEHHMLSLHEKYLPGLK